MPVPADPNVHVRDAGGGIHHEHAHREDAARHGSEIALVARARVERGIDGDRRVRAHEEGVAVARRARHGLRADRAACAGAILHDELLAQRIGERLREEPREGVCAAAG